MFKTVVCPSQLLEPWCREIDNTVTSQLTEQPGFRSCDQVAVGSVRGPTCLNTIFQIASVAASFVSECYLWRFTSYLVLVKFRILSAYQ